MALAVTLLPAVLGFVGTTIDRFHVPFLGRTRDPRRTLSFRWSRVVQRRPWPAAIASLAVLLALAAPVLGLRLGFPDAGNGPDSLTSRRAYDLLTDGFGPGFNGHLLVTADLSAGGTTADLEPLRTRLAGHRRRRRRLARRAQPGRGHRRHRRHPGHRAPGRRDRGAPAHRPRRHHPRRRRRHRDDGLRRRADRRLPGPDRGDRPAAAAVHRRRGRPQLPAATRRVPLAARRRQGRADEPAQRPGRLRRHHRRRRRRLVRAAHRHPHRHTGAQLHPDDDVRHPVRPQHGLRGVPPVPHPRGVPAQRRQRRRRRRRSRRHRPDHHRRRRDHDRRLPRLRARRPGLPEADRRRHGHRHLRRRHPRPDGARPRLDGAARRPQLVAAPLARPPPPTRPRRRPRRGPPRPRRHANTGAEPSTSPSSPPDPITHPLDRPRRHDLTEEDQWSTH